jgi:anti-anti-sigma factor
MSTDYRLDVSKRDGVTIVRFKEHVLVNVLVVNDVGSELNEMANGRDCRKLIVDFFGVVALSSPMLGHLIKLHKKMAANLGQLVLCGLSPDLRNVLNETRLNQLFKIRETEAEALAALV